jgi:two-component system cell cycle response regulator DivK
MTSHSPTAPLVLIVDDNERNRKLVRDVLHSSGLATLEAATGTEAIAVAAERLPNVILLDLSLPDMAGMEVARQLGDGARTMHIPVVALSALHDAEDHDWLLTAGFAGFLSKPIDVVAFPDQVRGYCGTDDV